MEVILKTICETLKENGYEAIQNGSYVDILLPNRHLASIHFKENLLFIHDYINTTYIDLMHPDSITALLTKCKELNEIAKMKRGGIW